MPAMSSSCPDRHSDPTFAETTPSIPAGIPPGIPASDPAEVRVVATRRRRGDLVYRLVVGVFSAALAALTRRRVAGLDRVPDTGGTIVCSNHISFADPVVLGCALYRTGRHARALAKASLFDAPLVGWVLRQMGHIPVHRGTDRAKDALATAIERLRGGEIIALYPEGTVPDPSVWLGAGKTGAARLALATGAPVVPVAQWGAQELLPKGAKRAWTYPLRALVRRPVTQIRIGAPITLTGSEDCEADVRAGTETIMAAIADLLTDVRGPRPEHPGPPAPTPAPIPGLTPGLTPGPAPAHPAGHPTSNQPPERAA